MVTFITDAEIIKIIQNVVDKFLIPRFNVLGMNATGKWLDSLQVDATDGTAVIKGQNYTEFLTKGRKPGKRPPIAPLINWAKAKFGVGEKEAKSIAFAVATKIANSGTTWHEKGGTDLIELLNEKQVTDYINQNITVIINENLERELLKIL